MKKENFIFIINYNEGIYISKIDFYRDITKSISSWYDQFILENKNNLDPEVFIIIKNRIDSGNYEPILLEGFNNVWSNDLGEIKKTFFSMNIIYTRE